MSTSASASPLLLAAANLLWVALIVVIVIVVIRRRRRRSQLDPSWAGATVAQGVVTEQKYQYRIVGERHLYRITYRVHAPDGRQFLGWEDKYLSLLVGKPAFAVGTQHAVACKPGVTTEVRALSHR